MRMSRDMFMMISLAPHISLTILSMRIISIIHMRTIGKIIKCTRRISNIRSTQIIVTLNMVLNLITQIALTPNSYTTDIELDSLTD